MTPTVVFFDGVCNLCNGFIDWLMRADRQGRLRFGSLQGNAAQELLGPEADALATLIVVSEGQIYRESDAVIAIGLALGGIHAVGARVMKLVPGFIRNRLYRLIARRRYSFFGRRLTCRLPTAQERSRFLS
jgi:predicted DCC family thiol-disulfide oxidoreductase YuxK